MALGKILCCLTHLYMNCPNLSIQQVHELIKLREISCVDLVTWHFDLIKEINPVVNAITYLDKENAMLKAKLADQAYARHEIIGPLHGIPYTAKDNINIQGLPTTYAAKKLLNNLATENATIIHRVNKAGGILLGKTNVPLFLAIGETDNSLFGRTNNPYGHAYIAGGSSGGEAAAVASCMSMFGLGNDLGGSIITPSHFCGVAGIRPTVGRIPTTGYASITNDSAYGIAARTTVGAPITRRVADLKLLVNILQGEDYIDATVVPYQEIKNLPDDAAKNLSGIFYTDNNHYPCSATIKNALHTVACYLQKQNIKLHEKKLPGIEKAFDYEMNLFGADGFAQLHNAIETHAANDVHPLVQQAMKLFTAREMSSREFFVLWQQWDEYRSKALQFMQNHDFILAPSMPETAFLHGNSIEKIESYGYIWAYTLLGWPVITLRVGSDDKGLPVNILLVSKPWQEAKLFAIAELIEGEFGGWERCYGSL